MAESKASAKHPEPAPEPPEPRPSPLPPASGSSDPEVHRLLGIRQAAADAAGTNPQDENAKALLEQVAADLAKLGVQ